MICIIPARRGSKRIKKKNIYKFFGEPLISYSIKIAKKSKLFNKIYVSTDCKKIAKIAQEFGAEVPFLRSNKLSGDYSSTYDVLCDALNKLRVKDKYFFCLYPTAVLLKKSHLIMAYAKINKLNGNALIPIRKFESSPLRAFNKKGKYISFVNDKYYNSRSQDLKSFYFDSGTFYIFKTLNYLKSNGNLMKKTTFINLNVFDAVDINNFEDLKLAQVLYKSKIEKT